MYKRQIITYVILIAGLLLIVVPLYITLVTAFKSNEQSSLSYFTLPDPVYLDSFKQILTSERYYTCLLYTSRVCNQIYGGA